MRNDRARTRAALLLSESSAVLFLWETFVAYNSEKSKNLKNRSAILKKAHQIISFKKSDLK